MKKVPSNCNYFYVFINLRNNRCLKGKGTTSGFKLTPLRLKTNLGLMNGKKTFDVISFEDKFKIYIA